jgi:hypothetical protein
MHRVITAYVVIGLSMMSAVSAQTSNACDLNQDNAVNATDVQLIVNMSLGIAPCDANIMGSGVCNVIAVQRVVNAALGGSCMTGATARTVSLNWTASTSPNISGYNVYRTTVLGGPYTKINSSLVVGTTYGDSVQSGQTYYYVTTAVDTNQAESVYSNVATAIVPSP